MSKKIRQFTLDGDFIQEWTCPSDIEVATSIKATNVIKVCKGKRTSAGGFKWEYFDKVTTKPLLSDSIRLAEDFYNSALREEAKEVNVEKGTIRSTLITDFDPKDDIELAKLHKVNLDRYKISNYWSKIRPDGRFTSSVLAVKKTTSDIASEDVEKLLINYKSSYKPLDKSSIFINVSGESCCAFIDITDFHLDKRDIQETTPESKRELFMNVLKNTLIRCYQSYTVDKIAFVIGSDMLHTDNILGQTTKGTPQEYTLRWNESFEFGFEIYADAINMMKQFTNSLDIILVCGNHARTKEFYLAFALKKYFETDKSISFDISPAVRKIYTFGNTFIGLHHGNTKIQDLPLVFSKEFGSAWGSSKYHEIKVGDKHHYMEKDYSGVLIKMLPSLTGEDSWHNDNNYVNSVKGAICTIYEKTKGRIADIQERNYN